MEGPVRKGTSIVLLAEDGQKLRILVEDGAKRVPGIGVLDTGDLAGREFGSITKLGNRRFLILRPSVVDRIDTLNRKAQIVMPKDSAHVLMHCDINAGKRVAEAGSGTGALTVALANAVMPGGKVYSYDIRPEFLKIAKDNIEAASLSDACEFILGDVCGQNGITQKELDAAVFDIPEPWRVLDNAWEALRPCGHFACYTPTVNQVEQTVRALYEKKYIEVRTVETLQREMTVVEKGIRPSFDMLGHSGYLTFARKVLEKF